MLRKRIFLTKNESSKVFAPLSVLFVNNSNTSLKQIFEKDNWPDNGWTPIGIVVIPAEHNRYGDGSYGIASLSRLLYDGTFKVPTTVDEKDIRNREEIEQEVDGGITTRWGVSPSDSDGATYYSRIDGQNYQCNVQAQSVSGDTPLTFIDDGHADTNFPYTDLNGIQVNSVGGALSCFDGKEITKFWTDKGSSNPCSAATLCKNAATIGTSQGDWYFPALGEISYLPSIIYSFNETCVALNQKYGLVACGLDDIYELPYISITLYSKFLSYNVYYVRYGSLTYAQIYLANGGKLRPFYRFIPS